MYRNQDIMESSFLWEGPILIYLRILILWDRRYQFYVRRLILKEDINPIGWFKSYAWEDINLVGGYQLYVRISILLGGYQFYVRVSILLEDIDLMGGYQSFVRTLILKFIWHWSILDRILEKLSVINNRKILHWFKLVPIIPNILVLQVGSNNSRHSGSSSWFQ